LPPIGPTLVQQAIEIGFQLCLTRWLNTQARTPLQQAIEVALPQTRARRKNGDGLEQTIAVVQSAIQGRNPPRRLTIDQDGLNSGPSVRINR
jgi:hypothetical protein